MSDSTIVHFGGQIRPAAFVALLALCGAAAAQQAPQPAAVKERPIPRLVKKDGRYALMVDGAPYLMLGAQAHNSSGWPGVLPKVWPAIEYLHANTLEIPVYWEQIEAHQGQFDFSVVDTIITQAREHLRTSGASSCGSMREPTRTGSSSLSAF